MNSGNLNFLEPSGPLQACNGIALPFTFTRWELVVNATSRPLYPQERDPGTHYIGGWVGPRSVLDGCGKSRPLPGFDPQTDQSVASRYTD